MYEYVEKKSVLLQWALSQDLPDVVPELDLSSSEWEIWHGIRVSHGEYQVIVQSGDALSEGGVAGGIAWSFFDYSLDLGFGGKLVQRVGVDKELHLADEEIVELLEDKKTTKLMKLAKTSKTSLEPDLGAI